jgi:dTDP-4-dehydrorhamnose reductase
MKVLVLGATGMAGHTIALYFKEKGHEIISYSRSPFKYTKNIIGDVFETEKLKTVLIEGNYDAVINCIGILNQDAEDNTYKAIYLNTYLPHLIVDTLKNTNTKLIHMSTDCVFTGNSGPYFEDSFCDGKSFYDRTKALGEINDDKNLTFRNSIIGPDMNFNGIGLFNWFMKQNDSINGYTGAIWTGVTTLTLAKAMEKAIEQNLCGLYNLVNNESISKYDLLQIFNNIFFDNMININKNCKFQLDKSLKNTRNDFSFEIPSYIQMVLEMHDWITKHKNLYPHYNLY